MVTLKQLLFCRAKKTKKQKNTILQSSPQKKAICLKVYTMNPKKPNSAERKVAKIKFSNGKTTIGYIPGEGHSLQQHSIVLVEGGRIKDLPGIKYKFIKGIFDFS
uniref:Ribosomal protein S12 n=1 Tax=Symphyocladiella dendroidea TaxID=2506487 RepID=UPI0022FD393C|nr:Ribosomal protein S12 [Symphyocladiella dendroidea]WAX04039.1 Ribosomal protein S12 [Symphyocladiella dendroidea]